MNRSQKKRNGYMLVAVFACLSLVMALTIAAVQTALLMRREVRKQHIVSQANLLCEAGFTRASNRRQDPEYVGETWSPTLPELPGKRTEVSIVFLERSPTRSLVQVTAVIDDIHAKNNRVQRTLVTSLIYESQSELP